MPLQKQIRINIGSATLHAPRPIRLQRRQRQTESAPRTAGASEGDLNRHTDAVWKLSGVLWSAWALWDSAEAADPATNRYGGFLSPISDTLETVLNTLQDGLHYLHVPYSYGFSIILLTVIVKIITYPFTKKQVESAIAMQRLKPRIDNIKLRYGDDKEKVQRETSILYDEAGVDPTAGCFPTLATIPILWGLFRTLSNVANEGSLDSEGFFWIPSLAGPTSIAARRAGTGLAWLYPFVDGAPPVGWEEAVKYLILPVLLIGVQYYSSSVISPVDPNDEGSKRLKYILAFLPLLVGYFALNVPSGLSLYYFSNTILTTGQQYWLRNLGGADVEMKDLGPVTKLGMGRRTGEPIVEELPAPKPTPQASIADNGVGPAVSENSNGAPTAPNAVPTVNPMFIRTRSKRKKLNWKPPRKPKKKKKTEQEAELPA